LEASRRNVFIDCAKESNLSTDYVCNGSSVLKAMRKLNVREVRFEKKVHPVQRISIYDEEYFQRESVTYAPAIYYLYEYCEAGEKFGSQTIFYDPINFT
jgi:hypothetical protein